MLYPSPFQNMKLFAKLKRKKKVKKTDMYQDTLVRFGKDQFQKLADRGLGWQTQAV